MADNEFEFRRGYHYGIAEERQRILNWVEENRSLISLGDGDSIARDHFNSESLIAFIESEDQ